MTPPQKTLFATRSDPRRRLNAICPYFTMFPLEFPLQVLQRAAPGQWVLDPFCGRGTTLFASRILGLPAVGIDTNPVACALAEAKLVDVDPAALLRHARRLLHGDAQPAPEGEFWEWAFHEKTLRDLCRLRKGLLGRDDSVSVALRALVLGILHGPRLKGPPTYLSNQMPRTYATKPASALRYWQKRHLKPEHVDVLAAVERRVRHVFSSVPRPVRGRVHRGDARRVLPRLRRRFDWVITSPPYAGMRTYLPDQWLRAWFIGGEPTVEYTPPDGQIVTGDKDKFVTELAAVWKAVAARSAPGARMVIRLGSLPSVVADPYAVVERSLTFSGARWKLDGIRSAGAPAQAARQAHQFSTAGSYVQELDFFARLDEDVGRKG